MPENQRPVHKMIDQAILENRNAGLLLYSMAGAVVLCGVILLIGGFIKGEGTVAIAGGIASCILWPSMRYALNVRKQNIAIRLLEIPLSQAETAEEAAHILSEAFAKVFIPRGKESNNITKRNNV